MTDAKCPHCGHVYEVEAAAPPPPPPARKTRSQAKAGAPPAGAPKVQPAPARPAAGRVGAAAPHPEVIDTTGTSVEDDLPF